MALPFVEGCFEMLQNASHCFEMRGDSVEMLLFVLTGGHRLKKPVAIHKMGI